MTGRHLVALLQGQAARLGPRVAIRYKLGGLYHDVSWRTYWHWVQAVASRLIAEGIKPGDRIGSWSENRLGWLITDMGIMAAGAAHVPAHNTLSAKQVEQQFAHAEISWLFVATQAQHDQVRHLTKTIPTLKGIVRFDAQPANDVPTLEGWLARGEREREATRPELDRRLRELGPSSLATIMYTSGTTGHPKGVMLTHENLLSNALCTMQGMPCNEESVVLSWLPYSHIYGRLVDHYVHLASGSTLCLAVSQDTLIENLAEIQPTNFAAVPRFYEKVLAFVRSPNPEETKQKLRHVFGRRIQWLSAGGAPLPVHVGQVFLDAGLLMLQGYGLTETSPVITFNRPGLNKLGTVGQALAGIEVATAPDGEVITRGPHVMPGYWKDKAATDAMIRDGWLYTGDLGEIDKDGYLKITGRKKELMVLSNGKKVVPPEIESVLLTEPCIDQVVLYGEGKHYVSALIVPNFDKLKATLGHLKLGSNDAIVQHLEVVAYFRKRLDELLKDAATYEKVQRFVLLPKPFSQEAEELTVSLKLRRQIIFQHYAQEIAAMYAE